MSAQAALRVLGRLLERQRLTLVLAGARPETAGGPGWTDSGLVVTKENGEPVSPKSLAWHLKRLSRGRGRGLS